MSETQRIAFRFWQGEVTAILPDQPANVGKFSCYAHVGQHGECDIGWYQQTRLATLAEYKPLLAELTRMYAPEYKLRIVKRIARVQL